MPTFSSETLREFVSNIFVSRQTPRVEADTVAGVRNRLGAQT